MKKKPTTMRHAVHIRTKGGTASPGYKENIILNPKITEYEYFDWIRLAQDILQMGMSVKTTFFLSKVGNFLTS
jgi:hypothetical protein